MILCNGGYQGTENFDTTLEDYKVIYDDGTSDYITKDDFDCVQVILL